jgi:putative transposase
MGRRYVQQIDHIYARTGTLWDGRYKSSRVQAETCTYCSASATLS